MKLLLISDTHGLHGAYTEQIQTTQADVLIHAGDVTKFGNTHEVNDFMDWLVKFEHIPHKIFIGGNHDRELSNRSMKRHWFNWAQKVGLVYLEHTACVIDGVRFFGSPYTPEFFNWHFMYKRGEEARSLWNQIPRNTNVLITHGPPLGMRDKVQGWNGDHVGCRDLARKVLMLEELKLHVFGHIHNGYGPFVPNAGVDLVATYNVNFYQTRFSLPGSPTIINAALLDEEYKPVNAPILIEI